jgi:hypothetical protein
MKVHLQHSDDPLTAGNDIEALCGKVIARAAFALWADTEFGKVAYLNSAALCVKCYLKVGKGRYLYAIAPGEEALHANTD